MEAWLQPLLDWIADHPGTAGVAIFLIAFSESVAVLGIIVPGAALLLGVGALVALGALELVPTLLWTMAGAICGDGLSFYIGRHYGERLRMAWPFRRHPEMFARGERFFARHGTKSIVFGRFVGPLRAVVPAIAGMCGMPPGRYVVANLLSSVAWAPVYILPGVALGASLGLASAVASRLLVIVVSLLALGFASVWTVRRLYGVLAPRAARWVESVQRALARHPLANRVAGPLLDPEHPEARALLSFAVLLVAATWGFVALSARVLADAPVRVDLVAFAWLADLRTPWADGALAAIAATGATPFLAALGVAVLIGAWIAGHRLALSHWLAAAAFAALVPPTLGLALGISGPPGSGGAASFPAAPVLQASVLAGFLAVLLAREIRVQASWMPYALATLWVTVLAAAQVYLGLHWLSDTVGAAILGAAWVALLGIGYRRHITAPMRARPVVVSACAACIAAALLFVPGEARRIHGLRAAPTPPVIDPAAWWDGGGAELPRLRHDFPGLMAEPLTLQYLGALDALHTELETRGWIAVDEPGIADLLRFLAPAAPAVALPLLPQAHGARHEAARFLRALPDSDRRAVLRLWASHRAPDGRTLYLGYVTEQTIRRRSLSAFAHDTDSFDAPLATLGRELDAFEMRVLPGAAGEPARLLVRERISRGARPSAG